MPALSPSLLLNTLVTRNATATNTTSPEVLQVVCAWPLSGQYGPGSRALYYVLLAACIFARKAEWLRSACLAAALLFPAVAALHSIVLAAVHVDGAVDMDVFGAFQLCSIGILAAPVTVKLSKTYFYDPGRNTIFVWTGLILAGLVSLAAEFFRIKTSPCPRDDSGKPTSPNAGNFTYGTSCGLICSIGNGPSSPMRGGSANNIYVIPAPDKLTFDTALLLAAACCIPAILSLISMWNKILEINWKSRFGNREEDKRINEPIDGTNGATIGKMKGINAYISKFLSAVEIPVFSAAVLAILITGERNFGSAQVKYQTEPIASIGQWAPIVGSGLAVLGSLYLLLASDLEPVKEEAGPSSSIDHCNCNCSCRGIGGRGRSPHSVAPADATDIRSSFSNSGGRTSSETIPTTSNHSHQVKRSGTNDVGNRRKVAKALSTFSTYLTTAAHDQFDDSEFKSGEAVNFPEVPGEEQRNRDLPQIREQYNQSRDAEGNVTPALRKQRSRASSFTGSIDSRIRGEGSSAMSRAPSPRRPHLSTLADRISVELQNSPSTGSMPRPRRDTLEVPLAVHFSHTRNPSTSSIITMPKGPSSPTIVVSSDIDMSSPAPATNPPTPP